MGEPVLLFGIFQVRILSVIDIRTSHGMASMVILQELATALMVQSSSLPGTGHS